MWMKNNEMRDVLEALQNGKQLPDWYIQYMLCKVEEAEQREQERIQRKRDEQIALCRKIYTLLAEQPERRLCPTDLQFMVYNRFGVALSCAKVARACHTMSWYKPEWFPKELLNVNAQHRAANKPGDDHAYFWVAK